MKTVAAPGYRCQICDYPLPLTEIETPQPLNPTFAKIECTGCNSYFMLKCKRVHGYPQAVISVVNCEPGAKARKILIERGKKLNISIENATKVDEIEKAT